MSFWIGKKLAPKRKDQQLWWPIGFRPVLREGSAGDAGCRGWEREGVIEICWLRFRELIVDCVLNKCSRVFSLGFRTPLRRGLADLWAAASSAALWFCYYCYLLLLCQWVDVFGLVGFVGLCMCECVCVCVFLCLRVCLYCLSLYMLCAFVCLLVCVFLCSCVW